MSAKHIWKSLTTCGRIENPPHQKTGIADRPEE